MVSTKDLLWQLAKLTETLASTGGSDVDTYAIEALRLIRDTPERLPDKELPGMEDTYKMIRTHPDTAAPGMVGYWGYALSWSGKWFAGWVRSDGHRDYVAEAYRAAQRQSPLLKSVHLYNKSYHQLNLPSASIVYCDPPYINTTRYKHGFDHNRFWGWCREKTSWGHRVFVSEYTAPDDFEVVWEGTLPNNSIRSHAARKPERLYVWKGGA